MEWIIQWPILLFSVVVHEFAHGCSAYLKGDPTPEAEGRLTFHPGPHVDAFGTAFLPLLCHFLGLPMFGWARPMRIDFSRFKSRSDRIWVAASGPAANLTLALALAIFFKAVSLASFLDPGFQRTALDALLFGVSINLLLAFFNLVPIHPLGGGRLLEGFLPGSWRAGYARLAPYGAYALLALVMSGALGPLVMLPSKAALSLLSQAGLIW